MVLWQKLQHPQNHEFLNQEVQQPAEDIHHCLGTTVKYELIILYSYNLIYQIRNISPKNGNVQKKFQNYQKKHHNLPLMCYILSLLKLYDSLLQSATYTINFSVFLAHTNYYRLLLSYSIIYILVRVLFCSLCFGSVF